MPVFLSYVPVKLGTGDKRRALLSQHLPRLQEFIDQGVIWTAGATHAPESISSPPAEREPTSSFMIFEADSYSAARAIVEADVFFREGVWDTGKLIVAPVRSAPRGEPKPNVLDGSYTYLAWLPDKKNEEVTEKRKTAVESHTEWVKKYAPRLKFAGIVLDPSSELPIGSVGVLEAVSAEDAHSVIQEDVYYTDGVWDSETLVITPIGLRGRSA